MEQTILNPKFLLSAILILSLLLIVAIVTIAKLWRRSNTFLDYRDFMYYEIQLLKKLQKEDHNIMRDILDTNKNIIGINNKLIVDNENLRKILKQTK